MCVHRNLHILCHGGEFTLVWGVCVAPAVALAYLPAQCALVYIFNILLELFSASFLLISIRNSFVYVYNQEPSPRTQVKFWRATSRTLRH